MFKPIFIACLIACVLSAPIAVFHGFGDSCSNKGMENFAAKLGKLVGDYSVCIEIGSGSSDSVIMDFKT